VGKIILQNEISDVAKTFHAQNKKIVFTNGCFDILHRGHVEYLTKAKQHGDVLIVGVNTDASVKKIKGEKRPLVPEDDRAILLAALSCVDFVVLFGDETPQQLIEKIIPDVLVKGADWNVNNIVGKEIVEANGGRVATIELVQNRSTTSIVEKILERYGHLSP